MKSQIKVPLLSKEKSQDGSRSPNRSSFTGGVITKLGQAILAKYGIRNELPLQARLPVDIAQTYLDDNVKEIKYEEKKKEYDDIWDTSKTGQLSNIRKIFEANRCQHSKLVKKQNFISTASLVARDKEIFIGTKDCEIRRYTRQNIQVDKREQEEKKGKKKSKVEAPKQQDWVSVYKTVENKRKSVFGDIKLDKKKKTKLQKEVEQNKIIDNILVSYDVDENLYVFDIKSAENDELVKIQEFQGVDAFDFKKQDGVLTIYLVFSTEQEQYIEQQIINGKTLEKQENKKIIIDLKIKHLFIIDSHRILASDEHNNVYLLNIEGGKIASRKLLRGSVVNNNIFRLSFHQELVTLILSDTIEKKTILATVDLELFHKEEQAEIARQEEQKRLQKEEADAKASPEKFKIWKKQKQMLLPTLPVINLLKTEKPVEKAEEKKKEEEAEPSYEAITLDIGECTGFQMLYTQSGDPKDLLISGTTHFVIMRDRRWRNKAYEVITDFIIVNATFAQNGDYLLILGQDGYLREFQYDVNRGDHNAFIKDEDIGNIQDAVSTSDGQYFAFLSRDQTQVTIYSYVECKIVDLYQNMDHTFLMNFTACSKALICCQATSTPHVFDISIFRMHEYWEERITGITVRIEEDYITQIDASLSRQQIYFIGKSNTSSTLHVVKFDHTPVKQIRDAVGISLSTDENLLAYSTKFNQVLMIYLNIPLDPNTEEKPVNIIRLPDRADTIQFYDNNLKIACQTCSVVVGHDVYTHKQLFKIQTSQTKNEFKKLKILFDTYLSFTDGGQNVMIFDFNYQLGNDYINLISKPLRSIKLKVNCPPLIPDTTINPKDGKVKKFKYHYENHCAWAAAGKHVILIMEQMINETKTSIRKSTRKITIKKNVTIQEELKEVEEEVDEDFDEQFEEIIKAARSKLEFEPNPMMHYNVTNSVAQFGQFQKVEGLFIPILLGGPKLGTASFATMFKNAISGEHHDIELLQTPIFPYKLNSLHYFAMTGNVQGAQICFANKVKFCQDLYGLTPLDYAIQTKDKLIIEAVLKGINESDNEERTTIMRNTKLSILLAHPASVLATLLGQYGSQQPEESKFNEGLSLPTLFPLKGITFAESGLPHYSYEIAQTLHPPEQYKKSSKKKPVSTIVLNNPVPRNFCDESIELLGNIVDCGNDEIVRTKPIVIYLNRKWDAYAYKFFFFQFCMFFSLLMSLTFMDSVPSGYEWLQYPSFIITIAINTYFFLWELTQLGIQNIDYFTSFSNILDIGRLVTIYLYLYHVYEPTFFLPAYILPCVFMLMWFKILSYLSVFKPTRYLIKMIFEIIADIKVFLIILFTALFAYAQINFILEDKESRNLDGNLRKSYVLSLGELGDFDTIPFLNLSIFVMFSFFIPLVLMNMLIALMADSYARVQSNSASADARALAEMLKEMEEVVQFLCKFFKPNYIQDKFYFCFQTQVNDADGEEDWEGTVGQLKRTIEEATGQLQVNLIQSVDDINKRSTEKVVDNLLRANKSELDVIDKVQKLLEKETANIRNHVQEKLFEESQKVKKQFTDTLGKLEEQKKLVEDEFKKTSDQLQEENKRVQDSMNSLIELEHSQQTLIKEEFQQTKTKLEEDKKIVQEEFKKTQEKFTTESTDMKDKISKAQERSDVTSKQMQEEIKKAQEKVESGSKQMQDELKKAQTLIGDVNQQVVSTSSKIVENVQSSTSKTQDSLLKTIESTSQKDTEKVKEQVSIQSSHHKEMVTFAVDTQKKVTDLLERTANEQSKLLTLVDELRGVQNKALQSINNQEQELMKKKELEKAQQEAIDKIQKVLGELQHIEKEKSQQSEQQIKKENEKEKSLKDELKKIQDDLGSIQKYEAERLKSQEDEIKQTKQQEAQVKELLEKIQQGLEEIKKSKAKKDDSSDDDKDKKEEKDDKEEKKQGQGKNKKKKKDAEQE